MGVRRRLGERYALHDPPIGSGGMGTVWRAYDELLEREVAVKELRLPGSLSAVECEALRERAMAEARAAAGLHHPAIVAIHDVLIEDGRPWIVMHLVEGRALDEEVAASGPLDPRRAARIGMQLLDALTAAHAKGILHRDVKPQNVLIDAEGDAVLTDFGIAAVVGATRSLTQEGALVGTLGYVAPERMHGARAEPASDLWSLGATLYYAVEGRPAYPATDAAAVVAAVLTRGPDAPERAGSLWPVVEGLLRRDPGERLDGEAARGMLREVISGPAATPGTETAAVGPTRTDAPAVTALSTRTRLRRRLPSRMTAGGALLAVAAVLLAAWTLLPDSGRRHADAQDDGATTAPSRPATSSSPSPTLEAARFRLAPNVCAGGTAKAAVASLVPHAGHDYSKWTEVSSDVTCEWEAMKDGSFSWPSLKLSAQRYATVDAAQWEFGVGVAGHRDDDVIEEREGLGDKAFFAHKERGFPLEVVVEFRISNVLVSVQYEYDSDTTLPKSKQNEIEALARELEKKTRDTAG